MTQRFADRLTALAARLPVAVVAEMAMVSWDTVQRLDAEAIAAAGVRPEVKDLRLRWIGVDEVSWTGGRRYFTVVTDLKTGQVVWIGDGRGEKGLLPFLRKLGKTGRRRIRGVVSDLGYVGIIERRLPQAIRILDRFHIVQWMNHALEEIRRAVFGRAPRDATGRRLKQGRWLLLTAREKLEHKFKLLLHRLMATNKPLYQGYLLKEQLREILGYRWKYPGAVRSRLRTWVHSARATKLEPLRTVADRIEKHIESIVNGYRYHLPMGLVESTNSKIAALRVQARGYRKPEYFKLKIFQRCNLKHNPWAKIIL
jgi:transposase